ncbi:mitogen-activated protein kinase kinase kinase 15 [Rhynchocyon petersi]
MESGGLPPGAAWEEPEDAELEGAGGPRRALRVLHVCAESSSGPTARAQRWLLRACVAEGAHLASVTFGELDFGETAVLDAFYSAAVGALLLLPSDLQTSAAPHPHPQPSTPTPPPPAFRAEVSTPAPPQRYPQSPPLWRCQDYTSQSAPREALSRSWRAVCGIRPAQSRQGQALQVLYVCAESYGGPARLTKGAYLACVPLGELDFGKTAIMDAFYSASEAAIRPPSGPKSHPRSTPRYSKAFLPGAAGTIQLSRPPGGRSAGLGVLHAVFGPPRAGAGCGLVGREGPRAQMERDRLPPGAARAESVDAVLEGAGWPRRALRVLYVCSESSSGPEARAQRWLLRACKTTGVHLASLPFGELDFGETAVLDAFYSAALLPGAAELDRSVCHQGGVQPVLACCVWRSTRPEQSLVGRAGPRAQMESGGLPPESARDKPEGAELEGAGRPRRALRIVCVCAESSSGPEARAQRWLLRAGVAEGAHLASVSFGELDFGETAVLDAFYSAGPLVKTLLLKPDHLGMLPNPGIQPTSAAPHPPSGPKSPPPPRPNPRYSKGIWPAQSRYQVCAGSGHCPGKAAGGTLLLRFSGLQPSAPRLSWKSPPLATPVLPSKSLSGAADTIQLSRPRGGRSAGLGELRAAFGAPRAGAGCGPVGRAGPRTQMESGGLPPGTARAEPEGAALEGAGRPRRALRVVCVCDESSSGPEARAQRWLLRACLAEDAHLASVPFGELDFGETAVLDAFYSADVAVVDMSDVSRQPSLFYHLGIRESFDMANNVILYHNTDADTAMSLNDMVMKKNAVCSGSYHFIPYIVTVNSEYFCCESSTPRCMSEYMQPTWNNVLSPLLVPLLDKFISFLKDIHVISCSFYKESLLNDIRKAREKYQNEELAQELAQITLRMDNSEVLTLDIVINLLLSYRDIQDYDAMVKLVETLEMLPSCDLADQYNIKFYYAFALNRRNSMGDREKALHTMLQVLQSCDQPAPDMLCLCGRIYKDIFLDSDCDDDASRDNAIVWYRKGFALQPSLYSGINLAVLLIVAGEQFETSLELWKIGVQLNRLLGKKGTLEKMHNYWDVGQFFNVSMLASDAGKAIQAAEKLFKMKPPVWYLRSVVQDLTVIQRFKKSSIEHYCSRQEELDFWLDMLLEAANTVTCGLRFPVLVIEPTKEYQPSYLSINNETEEKTLSLWHVSPAEMKQIHEWNFTVSSIKAISVSKFDERCCFLYVRNNSDEFQMYFSTEDQCNRFCLLVKEMIDMMGSTMELEIDTEGDNLEYEYDYDENGERVVLGKGTYGIVYAGRDLRKQVRIAIKEIPERDDRFSQSLHEEISLHKYLKHRNIVQHLGSISEDGYIKIFMEQVPGGSLSALLQSKWGPMKEPSIKFYTRQILEGLNYLHENQVVHRDIKGDNVLVNTYSGVVKISDFGTSKGLARVNPCTETFTGTLQYIAPEIIDQGPRGYGAPADIWSLGCTIIEMATSKPPFHELGDPQAALFKVGMFNMHPEIPETLSAEAKAFILSCFEPDPHKRPTAASLLEHSFLQQNQIAFKRSEGSKPNDLALPNVEELAASGGCRRRRRHRRRRSRSSSSSSEHNSVSPNSDVLSDTLLGRSQDPTTEEVSQDFCLCLSVSEDSDTSPPDRNLGLFHLRKDGERRTILYKILCKEQNQVASSLQEFLAQRSKESGLSIDHIKQVIEILRDFIRCPEHRMMMSMISKLKVDLNFNHLSISQIHLVLFGFQDAVNKILRNHLIQPHWMFAMDTIIRGAVQAAVNMLMPELQAHYGSSTELEGLDRGTEMDEDYMPAQPQGRNMLPHYRENRLYEAASQEAQLHQHLSVELGRLRQETTK